MHIALLGFGTIGKGVYELLSGYPEIRVDAVLCRHEMELEGARVIHDFSQVLQDPAIDTVVEVMGGLHPAWEYVRQAILAGKNVITANKAMAATFYDELVPLARKMKVQFRCTASVGGGISWLPALERVSRAETIRYVGGIMNGTCNYILDSMDRRGLTYQEALEQAQSLGYAEANPSTDVDGLDTLHKLILSSNVAFGVSVEQESIPVAGIRHVKKVDVDAFREHGCVCRLIASGWHQAGSFSAYVQPTLFHQNCPEFSVPDNYNLLTLLGNTSGRQSFYGQGAGRYPTAYNVVQDCLDLLQGRGFYCDCGKKVPISNNGQMCYYVRGESDAWLESHTADRWGQACITEPVSVQQMHLWLREHPGAFLAAIPAV